ncbi:hypothetical protein AB7849_17695 [Rhodanobacter sp. 115]|uniref:hypothetical protein n=1 Tax=Rhodanobacter sp. FW021-MT20 TaxID=1162282 RepID=UPI0034E3797B
MNGTLAQCLQDREYRLGVVIIGADVVDAGIHERPHPQGKYAKDDCNRDAVVLDVLLHELLPLKQIRAPATIGRSRME